MGVRGQGDADTYPPINLWAYPVGSTPANVSESGRMMGKAEGENVRQRQT